MDDKYVSFKGLFTTYEKVNTGKRYKKYYNEHSNNMLIFTPYHHEDDETDIINATIGGYKYLVDMLNTTKNVVVHWTKVEATTSDYEIYYDFDPCEFIRTPYREIVKALRDSVTNQCYMKFTEIRNGITEPIKDGDVN